MKNYICDVCGKKFGQQVGSFMAPIYTPSDFTVDSGFYSVMATERDVCTDCFNVIADAQDRAIKKLRPLP